MDLFPDEWELIGLFECERKLSDDDIPWAYNTLLFETTRGRDRLRCLIEAGYGDFRFHWWEGDKLRTQLELRFVLGLSVSLGGGRDSMTLTFRDDAVGPLTIQFKPHVSFEWQMNFLR